MKIFVISVVTLILTACGGIGRGMKYPMPLDAPTIVPTVDVEVINNCRNSIVYVKTPGSNEVAIPYSKSRTITLRWLPHKSMRSQELIARGVGTDGMPLGSDTKNVSPPRSGSKDDSWEIDHLSDGARDCRGRA